MFLQANLNQVLAWFSGTVRVLEIVLPMGISFYTFHALSYSIDVYRGMPPPVRSFVDFACYIALSAVGGRADHPLQHGGRSIGRPIAQPGSSSLPACRCSRWDSAKKILLANPMGQVADAAFVPSRSATPDAWFGVLAYAFQIYFDFSGYSDMAVGLGRMIGFEFLKNFDSPYHADSITDFWRRWHISLSTFLRDYLYIPLGGNRKGPARTYVNLIVVMLLGGLWHGANWTFVAWGAYHGTLLAFERFLGKQSLYHRLPGLVRVGSTFVLVLFSWVLFRSRHLRRGDRLSRRHVRRRGASARAMLLPGPLYTQGTLLLMAVCAMIVAWPVQAHDWSQTVTWPKAMIVQPMFCASLMVMFSQSSNPFLYFQF